MNMNLFTTQDINDVWLTVIEPIEIDLIDKKKNLARDSVSKR